MRRCKDNWVNATQILKLCNFPKAKRTKILERGVQVGRHEKVQGGYGRFQGTWIPLEDARNLANEFQISSDLVPVLYLDPEDSSVIIPRKQKLGLTASAARGNTPVKRKFPKKFKDSPKKPRLDGLPPQAVFVPEYMTPVTGNLQHSQDENPVNMHMPSMSMSHVPGNMHDYSQISANGHMSADSSFNRPYDYLIQAGPGFSQMQQRLQPQHQQSHLIHSQYQDVQANTSGVEDITQPHLLYQPNIKSGLSHGSNETNWSHEDPVRESDTSVSSNDAKNGMGYSEPSHAAQMLRYFSEDNLPIPAFIYNPTPEFDINDAIDDEGHTTLHWAASIGNLNLVLLVLSKGANPLVVSNFGMNPLSKCITFNNCYDLGNFQNVLNALEACLIHTDINGRTPLHYVCQFSKVRSKLPSLLHYTESMFKKIIFIAGHGTANGMNLFRNVLNHQDINGDTCLHLAARSACPEIYRYFLRHGARDDVHNSSNELPKSLMFEVMPSAYEFDPREIVTIFDQTTTPGETQFQEPNPASVQKESAPPSAKKRLLFNNGLGTPIQPLVSHTVTPDTQRTTVQEEEDEEDDVNDRVTKEHLQSLMEEATSIVDDNKENIFLTDSKKLNYGAMSTPKATRVPSKQSSKSAVENNSMTHSPVKDYVPNPPRLDKTGNILEDQKRSKSSLQQLQLPINDLASMLHGMVNSLTTLCTLEMNGLTAEQQRLEIALQSAKKDQRQISSKVKATMKKNGLKEVDTLDEALSEVEESLDRCKAGILDKEAQLSIYMERYQSRELQDMIKTHGSGLETDTSAEHETDERKLDVFISITKAQIKRRKLVKDILAGMKHYAIDHSMNKYRKLISLSCGLRVEDIDSLIDGIEESLSNTGT